MNGYGSMANDFALDRNAILIFLSLLLWCTIPVCCAVSAGSLNAQTNGQTSSISFGTAEKVNIDALGQRSQLNFGGEAGQLVSVQLSESTFPAACDSVVVGKVDSSGSTLTAGGVCGQHPFLLDPVALPTSETYNVVINPMNGGTGRVDVMLSFVSMKTAPVKPEPSDMPAVRASGRAALLYSVSMDSNETDLPPADFSSSTAAIQ